MEHQLGTLQGLMADEGTVTSISEMSLVINVRRQRL